MSEINTKRYTLEELKEMNNNIGKKEVTVQGYTSGSVLFVNDSNDGRIIGFSNESFNVSGASLFGIALNNANKGEDVLVRI